MLRPFKLVRHRIRKAQSFVNYISLEIICKAPKLKKVYPAFTSEMIAVEGYRRLLEESSRSGLLQTIAEIYLIAQKLSPQEIKVLRRAVLENNQIRELCQGKHRPVSYEELSLINQQLSHKLREFCDSLYRHINHNGLKAFTDRYLTLKNYYQVMVGCDNTCHCCAIDKISNQYDPIRTPFDHFLPKSIYPFTSINVHNLVPVCVSCNSSKQDKDTLFKQDDNRSGKERTKVFYPFRHNSPEIEIKIELEKGCEIEHIQPENIDMTISCSKHAPETESWIRLYDIENRYKAEICSSGLKSNYEQYLAFRRFGMQHDEIIKIYQMNKYGDKNILKIPLMECLSKKEQHAREKGFIDKKQDNPLK